MIRLPLCTAGLALALLVWAQATASAQVRVGTEVTRERATYHFDNPSNFDTDFLVPHYFEQTYVLDNLWVAADASYRAGVDMETSFGVTTERQARATDYDTFFNPGNVVWVAGTTGDAKIRSWRFGQQVRLGRLKVVTVVGGYRLRIDTADFLEGDKTEVRNGVLVRRETVTTREYTNAQRHDLYLGARVSRPVLGAWTLAAQGEVAPLSIHRLAIQLPDKYPGVTLVYRTTAATVSGRAELRHDTGRWLFSASINGLTTVRYHPDQWVSRSAIGGGVSLGRTW